MLIGKPIVETKGTPLHKGTPEYIVKFEPNGASGNFSTNDEELAKRLREHPEFGKRFVELGAVPKQESNIVSGIRSSLSHPELGEKKEFDPQKLIEFGKLQATLLKNDGTYRKDASEENKQRYELLKKELE